MLCFKTAFSITCWQTLLPSAAEIKTLQSITILMIILISLLAFLLKPLNL